MKAFRDHTAKEKEEHKKKLARIVAAVRSIAKTSGFPVKKGEENLMDTYLNGLTRHTPVSGITNQHATANRENQRGRGIAMALAVTPDSEIQVLSHTIS